MKAAFIRRAMETAGWKPRSFSDFAVLAITAAYVMGFLGWALHATTHGLVLSRITPSQFLGAGVVLGALAGLVALSLHFAFLVGDTMRSRRATPTNVVARACLEALFAGLGMYILTNVSTAVGSTFNLLRPAGLRAPITAGVAVACLYLAFLGVTRVLILREAWQNRAKPRRRLGKRSHHDKGLTHAVAFVSVMLAGGLVAMPAIAPAYGGARERHAWLDLEVRMLSDDLAAVLLPPNATGEVVRSVQLVVLWEDAQTLMVRTAERQATNDPLYELSGAAVTARIWM